MAKLTDDDFIPYANGLNKAASYLVRNEFGAKVALPDQLPPNGIGSEKALEILAPHIVGGATKLNTATAFAHMDPPTPWISAATALWNAALNQNLLHPATAPVARAIEEKVIKWLCPFFGMDGGHMTPGSTIANLTALLVARDVKGITEVVAGAGAHLSIAKAAHILGLRYRTAASSAAGTIDDTLLEVDLRSTALVLTAGTTSTGAIDPINLAGRAAWTHIDAAWSGPLRFTDKYGALLNGIEHADSVAMSAHKLLFQPKESGAVIFRDAASAHAAISFGGAYLEAPNIGILGSRGAAAVPLLATLLAWGRDGLAQRIERCMATAEQFTTFIENHPRLEFYEAPRTGIVVWRPSAPIDLHNFRKELPADLCSMTTLQGEPWLRCVAANPLADAGAIASAVEIALAKV